MAWYKSGTVAVTNGSPTITGTGTAFVANVSIGYGWVGPDGLFYEVTGVTSDTALTIDPPYRGATASGQGYRIVPTQGPAVDLALGVGQLIGSFGAVRDGIGQGLIPAGTLAAPGLRFAVDQDTGLIRASENAGALVAGGSAHLFWTGSGIGIGTSAPGARLEAQSNAGATAAAWVRNTAGFVASLGLVVSTTDNSAATTVLDVRSNNSAIDGGATLLRVRGDGSIGVGTAAPAQRLHVAGGLAVSGPASLTGGAAAGLTSYEHPVLRQYVGDGTGYSYAFSKRSGGATTDLVTITDFGNLLVGATSSSGFGNAHRISKAVAQGSYVLAVDGGTGTDYSTIYMAVTGGGYSTAPAAQWVGKNSTNNRSLNAAGTINASGADNAEYVRKAADTQPIAKGQVCATDANGQLTLRWSRAKRLFVKSTDPHLVGNDIYGRAAGPRPDAPPAFEPPAYDGPARPEPVPERVFAEPPPLADAPIAPDRADGEDDDAFLLRLAEHLVAKAAWAHAAAQRPITVAEIDVASAEHKRQLAQYSAELALWEAAQPPHAAAVAEARAAHDDAVAAHLTALAAWEEAHEAARQTVDRIAWSGQVPMFVTGPFAAGDYLVGAEGPDDTIVARAIDRATMAADLAAGGALYLDRLGVVLGVTEERRDPDTDALIWPAGRAWVDVQRS